MVVIKGFRDLLSKIRLAWVSLILSVKNFFSSNKHTPSNASINEQNANNGYDGNTKETSVENKIEIKGNEIDSEDEQDIWHDALEEQEEFFDAVESLDKQETGERKEYGENKYYSLQDGLQDKIEFDHSTQTLALAFEIEPGNFNTDLGKFKLCKLEQNGNKYTFTLGDSQKNRIELHSEYLNMYFPKYFEKHSKKRTYTELFSPKENRINNDIIIPLSVPKEIDIFSGEFCRINLKRAIQSKIPDFPRDIYLKGCKNDVKFHLNSNNTISLSMTSGWTKSAAMLSGTPAKTNWPIKDVLIRGRFANNVNKHIHKQLEMKVDSDFECVGIAEVEEVSSGFKIS